MPDAPDLTDDELVLAADFPAATRRDWQRLVARVLHSPDDDAAPERELATLTLDGIEIAALYTADDGTGQAARTARLGGTRPAPASPGSGGDASRRRIPACPGDPSDAEVLAGRYD